ncbi:uncharacterized protein B0H18DRAFT_963539 [Fomitopsis serialis]|uniref:uncharacterized protein n=1 Tax=Fomitopsis serialis TaxID=139415 RepID=UPI002008AA1B|nr:uncharacterized protein B0H18DRAFT_963539 [Neoantrodia serialis]KAH9910302.1 hypothetical protein B0H18DRAFT_963539 [Neoantrodia serialis]
MTSSFAAVAARLGVGLIYGVANIILPLRRLIWDLASTLHNAFSPLLPEDRVVPEGRPGEGGLWPRLIPPKDTDSWSCFSMLNAMANQGTLPRNWRNITSRELNTECREIFNLSPTSCFFAPHHAANAMNRNYWTDRIDLSAHNCVDYDARGRLPQPDQSEPVPHLIKELLESGTDPGGDITASDLPLMLGKRGAQSRLDESAAGGKDLYPYLIEERIRNPGGLMMTTFQNTVLKVELGITEEVEDTLRLVRMGSSHEDAKPK